MVNKKEKEITNKELLESINRSFSRVEKKMVTKEDVKGIVKEEVEGLKNQLEGVNKRIDNFVVTRVKYEDHNKLKSRVDLIESKLK